ncbi:MAG TPA: M48 family metalloprotease [Candidatus Binatia bacterium]|jgi:predicted Zn-dependent protease|nr:M48 family metalloprotease [Candidatus Binatia bacterium]
MSAGRGIRRAVALVVLALIALPGQPAGAGMDEREIGRRFLLEARGELPLIEDPAVKEYVERVGRRLVKTLGSQSFDYSFYVVQDPSLNAFAVPGGYVFVFSGLLARVKNDDELAGVLGHEIGHAAAHHIVRQQAEGQVASAASLLGLLLSAVNPVLGAGAIAAAQTAQLKYSREFEQEADYLGLRYATEAGFDPHALGSFFKELLAEQRLNPAGVPPYMLSHPMTETRVANIETIITTEKLKTPSGRPAAGPDLAEAQAIARAIVESPDVALARYRKLADEKPNDAEAQFLLGRVYQQLGRLDAARTALERSRELGGLGDRVDRPLGSVYTALKQTDKAHEVLDRYLTKHPDDGWVHLELGKAIAERDEAAALVEYRRAIHLDPDLDEAHRLAGLALGRKGDEADGFYELAIAARLRGELEQSLSHFQRTEALLPRGSARDVEVRKAIEELLPIVRERERARLERRRRTGLR